MRLFLLTIGIRGTGDRSGKSSCADVGKVDPGISDFHWTPCNTECFHCSIEKTPIVYRVFTVTPGGANRARRPYVRTEENWRQWRSLGQNRIINSKFSPRTPSYKDEWLRLGITDKNSQEKVAIKIITRSDKIEELDCSPYRLSTRLRVMGAVVLLKDALKFGLMCLVFGGWVYTLLCNANEAGSEGLRLLRVDPGGGWWDWEFRMGG